MATVEVQVTMGERTTNDRLADVTPMAADQLYMLAEMAMAEHDPKEQGHGYDRCGECHFTHHPCDTFDLAGHLIALLHETAKNDS